MQWNIYIADQHKKAIVPYNIFQNSKINKYYKSLTEKDVTNPNFREELRKTLAWAFKAKSEYELSVNDLWLSHKVYERIDAYDQLLLNLDRLASYIKMAVLYKSIEEIIPKA